ncbi:MAG TPA: hypothetical protein VFD41_13095, partial [Actinomycetales bacterium]|nr:hypothetical protein [Actinomycetales bacterium]
LHGATACIAPPRPGHRTRRRDARRRPVEPPGVVPTGPAVSTSLDGPPAAAPARPPDPLRTTDDAGRTWLPPALPPAGVRVGRGVFILTPRQAARAHRWVRTTNYDRVVRRLS